jgi:hypothetical protein
MTLPPTVQRPGRRIGTRGPKPRLRSQAFTTPGCTTARRRTVHLQVQFIQEAMSTDRIGHGLGQSRAAPRATNGTPARWSRRTISRTSDAVPGITTTPGYDSRVGSPSMA